MTVPAIGPLASPVVGPPRIDPPAGASGASPAGGSFAAALGAGLDQVQKAQTTADGLAVQAATGTLSDPSQYLIASTQASLATELTAAVRNKAVEAFNQIMAMQA